jgi:glucosamine--fructose-6-phosphate aminotransferase (isomerizing)
VVGSTISRLTDAGIFTRCGVEVGVASTKAFTGQILALLLLALHIGQVKGNLSYLEFKSALEEIKKLSDYIRQVLNRSEEIKYIAKGLTNYQNFFFLGRMYQLPIADESSLKFKEITYLHSEAYPA